MTLVFPVKRFNPTSLKVGIVGAAVSGGRSVGGVEPLGEFSGGGLWSIEFGAAILNARDNMMTWRALEAALDNGAAPIIVPLGDRRNQPIVSKAPGTVAFSDLSLFDDATSWTPLEVDAVTNADASLRATRISFTYTGLPLIGGEHFSILHAVWGWRLYRIIRIISLVGDVYTVDIRTPLRAAVASGTPLNFESPRCVCRVDGDITALLDMLRFGTGGPAKFIETFQAID